MDDMRWNCGLIELDPNEFDPNDVDPNVEDVGIDERNDRMNVDDPADVGLVDIVSIELAWFTAAEPIRGPIDVELEPVCTADNPLAEAPPERLDKNVCDHVGAWIIVGYRFVDSGEDKELPSAEEVPNDVVP